MRTVRDVATTVRQRLEGALRPRGLAWGYSHIPHPSRGMLHFERYSDLAFFQGQGRQQVESHLLEQAEALCVPLRELDRLSSTASDSALAALARRLLSVAGLHDGDIAPIRHWRSESAERKVAVLGDALLLVVKELAQVLRGFDARLEAGEPQGLEPGEVILAELVESGEIPRGNAYRWLDSKSEEMHVRPLDGGGSRLRVAVNRKAVLRLQAEAQKKPARGRRKSERI